MSRIQPADLPPALFAPDMARLLHLTGITPALSESAAATCRAAVEAATQAGWGISFDLNYRSKLWSPGEARQGCQPFMQAAQLLFVPLGDARVVYGFDAGLSADSILEQLAAWFPAALIVMTMGKDGALARTSDGQTHHQAVFEAGEVGRLGGGDSFSAGFLFAHLQGETLPMALRWGAAVAALKYTMPGDMPLVSYDEAVRLVAQQARSHFR